MTRIVCGICVPAAASPFWLVINWPRLKPPLALTISSNGSQHSGDMVSFCLFEMMLTSFRWAKDTLHCTELSDSSRRLAIARSTSRMKVLIQPVHSKPAGCRWLFPGPMNWEPGRCPYPQLEMLPAPWALMPPWPVWRHMSLCLLMCRGPSLTSVGFSVPK